MNPLVVGSQVRRAVALVALFVSLTGALPGRTASNQRDLGEGLTYVRIHELPADLPSGNSPTKEPVVIDVRFAKADNAAALAFGAWLKFHATARAPIFVLINGGTAPAIAGAVREQDNVPGLLTVGPAAQRFEPDIIVTVKADDDRRAYDALESGTSLAALTTDYPEKVRNDEASLAHDHAPLPPDGGDDAGPSPSSAQKKAPPLIDAVLQRAVHVYRGLKALKPAR